MATKKKITWAEWKVRWKSEWTSDKVKAEWNKMWNTDLIPGAKGFREKQPGMFALFVLLCIYSFLVIIIRIEPSDDINLMKEEIVALEEEKDRLNQQVTVLQKENQSLQQQIEEANAKQAMNPSPHLENSATYVTMPTLVN